MRKTDTNDHSTTNGERQAKVYERILDDIINEDMNTSMDEEARKQRGLLMSANISALSHRLFQEHDGNLYEYETLGGHGFYLNGKVLLLLGENQSP